MRVGHAGEEGGEGRLLLLHRHGAGLGPGQFEEVVDQPFHPEGVSERHVDEGRFRRRSFPHRVPDRLEVSADIRQRGPQFVGGVGDEVALDLREPPLLGDVPKGEEDVRVRFPQVPHRRPGTSDRAASLSRDDGKVPRFRLFPLDPPVDEGEGLGMADHFRVRASRAHRLRSVEDLPGFPVHHPHRPIGGDDDDPVVEVGEQRLEARLPRVQLPDRVGEVRRHPVHRVRHVFELVARPDLDAPGEIAGAHLLRRRLHLRQGTGDPPRHEGGSPEDQEERGESRSPDDRRDLPQAAGQGRDGDRGAGRPDDRRPRSRSGGPRTAVPRGR